MSIRSLASMVGVSMLLAPSAFAGTAVLTWDAPTMYEDGSPLTAVDEYRLYYGCQASGQYDQQETVDGAETTYVVEGLPDIGVCYFVATAVVGSLESVYSNEASKSFGGPVPPSPPANLVVDPGELTAYGLVQSRDNIVLLPVGTVAPDTECDGSKSVNGRYMVLRELVTFAGSVRPEVVFANCLEVL